MALLYKANSRQKGTTYWKVDGFDVHIETSSSPQVGVMWHNYLLIFGQVTVELQHVCSQLHSTETVKQRKTIFHQVQQMQAFILI